MPDITMCTNNSCPVRYACYRNMAKPNCPQSYAEFKWEWKDRDKTREISCKHFIPIKE